MCIVKKERFLGQAKTEEQKKLIFQARKVWDLGLGCRTGCIGGGVTESVTTITFSVGFLASHPFPPRSSMVLKFSEVKYSVASIKSTSKICS